MCGTGEARAVNDVERNCNCKYCHTDIDGYTNGLDKKAHAYIWKSNGKYGLELRARGWSSRIEINFCPMCGRKLCDE